MSLSPPDDADLDKATIYQLNRMGWSFAQIAEAVDADHDTILRVLRDAPEDSGSGGNGAPLAIHLTQDARLLRIVLPSDALPEPTAVVLALTRRRVAAFARRAWSTVFAAPGFGGEVFDLGSLVGTRICPLQRGPRHTVARPWLSF